MPSIKSRPSGRRNPDAQELDTLTRLFNQGLTGEAEILAKSLTRRFPRHGFGWKVLGAVYQAQDRYEESLNATRHAVALLPDDAATHNNLGTTLQSLGRSQDAELHIRKALAIAPGYAKALNNLGTVLRRQGRLLEAEACCRHALRLEPRYTNAHVGLGNTLELQDRSREAQTSYRAALAIQPDMAAIHTDLLHLLTLDVQVEPQQLFAEHLAFGEQFEAPLRGGWRAHHNIKDPTRCLQVGFVSGDLYNHAVASFLEPVLTFLAKKPTLSLHAYYTHSVEDEVTQRLRSLFPHWHTVASLSDADLAQKIRADGIDILIDLSGHTAKNRLLAFARKPAPVQASWMGYPGTTGLQAMDYFLCDRFWIPPGEMDWQFTEKLALMPATAIFLPSEHAPPVKALPALEMGYITFGSFNRLNKINDSVIVLWSMLMGSVPNSRLVLGAIPMDRQAALTQSFANAGIEQSRLTYYPRSTLPDYLSLHHQVDICLDTFPYSGGTTTHHAAWMGVPTLTLAGEAPPSRSGATILNQWGLNAFIATTIEDFLEKGRYWAQHVEELAVIRLGMRARFDSSAMGQPESFAANLDASLRAMWQRWCSDLPPAHIEASTPSKAELTSNTQTFSSINR